MQQGMLSSENKYPLLITTSMKNICTLELEESVKILSSICDAHVQLKYSMVLNIMNKTRNYLLSCRGTLVFWRSSMKTTVLWIQML